MNDTYTVKENCIAYDAYTASLVDLTAGTIIKKIDESLRLGVIKACVIKGPPTIVLVPIEYFNDKH